MSGGEKERGGECCARDRGGDCGARERGEWLWNEGEREGEVSGGERERGECWGRERRVSV